MTALIIAVAGLLTVAMTAALAPRLRVAAPLLLVVLGIAISFVPGVPGIQVDPEWILAGVLPPLLYSASVSMPAMSFRRDLGAIGGLSVVLVVLSSFVLGAFFSWVIPGLDLWWGVALGAIVSPTDAVATSIVRRSGVSGRVVAVLEGESLLNDATALVLLRTAVAGTAASVSLWHVAGSFGYSVAVAVVIGAVVALVMLRVRSRVTDPTVSTVLSFTVPFLASIPSELLGTSGLVAAVVAGLVTGQGAPRRLAPQHRLSETQTWRTVELVLEGAVFLLMGLELSQIVDDVRAQHDGVGAALAIAGGAFLLSVLVRTAYVSPLVAGLRRRARRAERSRPRLDAFQLALQQPEAQRGRPADEARGPGRRPVPPHRLEQMRTRLTRVLADIDYYLAVPLGWREGGVLVWAGMRGAVTLAAAQTLPASTPHRPLFVLVAFTVAAGSLLLQGSTLQTAVRWLRPAPVDTEALATDREDLRVLLAQVRRDVLARDAPTEATVRPSPVDRARALELAVIAAQRTAVLDARDDGTVGVDALDDALARLDVEQVRLELADEPATGERPGEH